VDDKYFFHGLYAKSSMNEVPFTIRSMQLDDISSAMSLSTGEGWNQTEKDWKFFMENEGNTCLVAEYEHKVIATTTAINYSEQVAWIAMVLVDKEYRGQGISKALLEQVLEKLQSCKSVKLDATPAGKEVYKRFDFSDEYPVARMTNAEVNDFQLQEPSGRLPELIQVTDITGVVDFDETVFGANRKQLIEYLVKEYPHKAWTIKRDNKIKGIALGRDGNRFHHIGPVLAANTFDAKTLVTAALKALSHQPVVLDVLCDKKELIMWLHSIGFRQQRQFTRMYQNHNPFPGLPNNQFLICGPEFG
jgi:GNAT superfamily N-acetyltransferase